MVPGSLYVEAIIGMQCLVAMGGEAGLYRAMQVWLGSSTLRSHHSRVMAHLRTG
jgi:hypothetical protein